MEDASQQVNNLIVGLNEQVLLGFFLLAIFLILGTAVLFILRWLYRSQSVVTASFENKLFMLTVPRMNDKEEEKKAVKEMLSGVESFYASLGGLKAPKGFKAWFFGRRDHWSFEIVVGADRLITFYMAIPAYLVDYVHYQLLSLYPHCQIEEVTDYNIFNQAGYVAGAVLRLGKNQMFPILTYEDMEVDPITGIISTMTKLAPGQTLAIQYVMRSARPSWRNYGVKVASKMQQGKNLKEAISATNGGGASSFLGKPSDWITSGKKEDKPVVDYRLSPMETKMVEMIEKKASKAGLDTNIRIIAFAENEQSAKGVLRQAVGAFSQFSHYQYANSFKATIKGAANKLIKDFIYRNFDEQSKFVLTTAELTSLWHLPLANTEIPNIRWLQARKLSPPVNLPETGVILGESQYRGKQTLVRIKDADRQRHMYIIGMTGTGKSYFMAYQAIQDINNGKGVCIVDPHGSLIEDILPYIPKERADDVILFDPSDMERPIGLNMLEASSSYEMDMAAQEMINIFYKLLPDPAMAGPMFEHYMRNALLALMADQEDPGTLVELARIFTDDTYRKKKLEHVKDILVKDFWEREYTASQKGSTGADMLSYVISKTGRFVENELMRNIIGQPKSGINFRQVMDEGKILLMNLSKGKIGETNSSLLGLIAVSKLQMAALARADMPEDQRKDFYLYIDEFQNFITDSISIILAEARKYRLNLIMGHQYISQLVQNGDSKVRDAIFGNVGTVASYRIGVDDAETIAKQLGPKVSEYDVMNTEKFNVYLRLLIDNTASDAFNMHIFNYKEHFPANFAIVPAIKELSRLKYGRDRNMVVREIVERSRIGQLGAKSPLSGL